MSVQATPPVAAEARGNIPRLQRTDNWWSSTLIFFVVFSAFGAWATFRAFQNGAFDTAGAAAFGGAHYLSPFYSPTIKLGLKLFGFSISPALLILPFPLSFRLSCYYYRKMLYRSYLLDPAGCAVKEPANPLRSAAAVRMQKYMGERVFPLVAQNLHRYAFYAAVVFIVILWKDTFDAFTFTDAQGTHFGVHLISLIFLINICLLTLYTFSCHSWRHLIGGGVDCYSCTVMNKTKYGMWQKVSFLNERHGLWAMMSLVSVAVTDFVVWLYASGHPIDIRFF